MTGDVVSTAWTREHFAHVPDDPRLVTSVLPPEGAPRMLPDIDFWDLWPARHPDGSVALVEGCELWAGLSAPAQGHPGARHDTARIRLVLRGAAGWTDCGPLFPDGASLGSREWAGCLVLDGDRLTAYYTAAGVRGEASLSFRQRLVQASGRLVDGPAVVDWSAHEQIARADGVRYASADELVGEPGFIKAFRDPFHVVDPADGQEYVLFTGTLAHARTKYAGCIGVIRGDGELLDPLLTADGVTTECERAHVVVHDGRYYLFLSTQARTFDPAITAPTGLYGFVADRLLGPYTPVNGCGLLLRNPPAEPFQAYSWLVLDDLTTTAFVDSYGLGGRHPDDLERDGADAVRRHFGGTMAPAVRLHLAGAEGWIEGSDVLQSGATR